MRRTHSASFSHCSWPVAGCTAEHNATDALAGVLVGCLAVAIAIFVARVVGVVVSARERAKEARA
jgi:ABC-type Co2+ transport system permease subunit